MSDPTATAALAAGQAKDSELVVLKQQVDRLRGDLTPGSNGQQKLRKACTDFEAVFISKMWEQMRATVPKEGYLHSPQEDMYRSMFDRDFAEKLAKDGGIGLGDMLYGQLKDKLKNSVKTTATDGAAAAELGAARELRQPRRGEPATRPEAVRTDLKPLRTEAQGLPLRRESAPRRPASVPGEVMGEVEALARRIEEDFDRRQQAANPAATPAAQARAQARMAGYGQDPGRSAGRKLADIG